MTLPVVTFEDPERYTIDVVEAKFTGRDETYKPTSVATGFPTAVGYHVQVDLENTPADDFPARERSQVRITCWAPAGKRTEVKQLASLTQGLLATDPRIRPIGGRSKPTTDPDTKAELCWFLVRVNLPGNQEP